MWFYTCPFKNLLIWKTYKEFNLTLGWVVAIFSTFLQNQLINQYVSTNKHLTSFEHLFRSPTSPVPGKLLKKKKRFTVLNASAGNMWLASYGLSGLALKYEFRYYVQVSSNLERLYHILTKATQKYLPTNRCLSKY